MTPPLYAVFLSSAPQRGLIYSEDVGSLLQRLCGCKNTADMLLFYTVKRNRITHLRRSITGEKVYRQRLDAHPFGTAQNGGPLDYVTQLSHVSGPMVTSKRLQCLIGEAQK